jgi:CheY-specific phosphatase CheX
MSYRIGIVTKNLSFFKLVDQERRSNTEIEMVLVRSKESLRDSENAGKVPSSFIFDGSLSGPDMLGIGSYIKASSRYTNSKIFLAFENYETLKDVTDSEEFAGAIMIAMPASAMDIYKKITAGVVVAGPEAAQSKTKSVSSASFLNIFIECTMNTIQEMANCPALTHSAPQLLDYDKLPTPIAIRGKLAINSPHFKGSFFISFPEKTFLNLSTTVLMEKVEKIEGNEDLVSELCNIVYGKSKVLISQLGMKLDMVIPTHNRDKKVTSSERILLVKLGSEMGDFYVKVAPGLL